MDASQQKVDQLFRPKSDLLRLRSSTLRRWFGSLDLFQQFTIACTIVLGVIMIALGSWVSERISTGVLKRSAEVGALYMESILEPHVQGLLTSGKLTEAEIATLDNITSNYALRRHVLSVKVWLPDGTIAYSSEKGLIGQRFATKEIDPALAGEVNGYLSELEDDENAFERTLNIPLYEIYAPIYRTGTSEIIAVGEFYENAERLTNELVDAALDNWLVVGGSAILMLTILSAIVYRGKVQIERQRAKLKLRFREQLKLHRSNERMQADMQEALRETAKLDHQIQRRIGAELNDGPAQLITFVLLRLDEIDAALRARPAARKLVASLRQAASEALAEIRAISTGLFLPHLDNEYTLSKLATEIIMSHQKRTGQHVDYHLEGLPQTCPTEVSQCIARITQEALNNSSKYAPHSQQSLSLTWDGQMLSLVIADDGPGFQLLAGENGDGEHLGLRGFKYRVKSVGGEVDIRSSPGQGTTIRCEIPFAQ